MGRAISLSFSMLSGVPATTRIVPGADGLVRGRGRVQCRIPPLADDVGPSAGAKLDFAKRGIGQWAGIVDP